jgi:hypothetical protein
MLFRWLAILAVTAFSASAQEAALVRVSDPWRCFKGTNAPAVAWQQVDFDDSAWFVGIGSFGVGQLYDPDVFLSDMPSHYLAAYFRNRFTLSDPASVKWLLLRIDYDDGFVAYLNGTEIARRGFAPGATVSFNTPAVPAGRSWGEEINLTAFTNLLIAGDNVLAIELHNSSLQDPSAALAAELVANFARGPFVQNVLSDRAQVIWKTPVPADTKLDWGTNGALVNVVVDTNLVITHVVTLTNLSADSAYSYRVSSSDGGEPVTSAVESFHTLKASGPVRFVVLGDSGGDTVGQYQIAQVIKETAPDLVLHVGDVIYPSFETNRADLRCLSVYQPHMKSTPYFFAFGNHDLYSGDSGFLETFYLPTNSATGTEHFYSFDHGDVHFCALFVPQRAQDALYPNYYLDTGTAQYRWLTNDLATSAKPWKILFFHIPVNTSGPHRFDSNGGVYDRLDLQRILLPIARQYGVQLILNGHDHAFERFEPMNGVHVVVTGGGGFEPYLLTERDPLNAQYWSALHCTEITVNGDTLRLQALDTNGVVFDSMTIQRALPPPQVYQAGWHSPLLESKPPDDGDGNINGQSFDFVGAPIPTLPGNFSSLGRVFVNNDALNLYVGFEQAMICGSNNVFLFVESPRQTGVTNMNGIGNGIIDPDGQGADGLDFLQNLSFTNFAPGVGCILGDEYGDYQYRFFARPNLVLNIGQGVFRLDAEINDVPGARLQQFNRSPQDGAVPGEQNADFIKVAIPLAELGGLQPGDTIKIGAVVGGPDFNSDFDSQTRQLDSGFLGSSLLGAGQGPVVLEGVSVQLALDSDTDHDGLTSAEEAALGTDPMNPDTDGDGLLDGWEARNALDPLSAAGIDGRDGDPDGDGLSNYQEQSLGSDPHSVDSDGDGLLDGWESRNGLNPAVASGINGAAGDPDGDGMSNAQEQSAGTDPRDAASVLRLNINLLSDSSVRLSWSAVVGNRYQLEVATNLLTGFVAYPGTNFPRTAASTIENFDESFTNPPAAARFYRIRLFP